ncbi:MAG: sirohydrochlorin chelatase [Casimicrobiaceae bacterium]
MKAGLVLFAHGARDPRWAEPFERLQQRVRALAPEAEVRLCYLELMQPDLEAAIGELVALGVESIRVVPIFLGQGGHVRRDLPGLIAAAQARFAPTAIECAAPAGEDEGVLDALARYCVG